jgi:serpin B
MAEPHRIRRLAVLCGITVLVGAACGARHDTQPESPPNPLPVAATVAANAADAVRADDRLGIDLLSSIGTQRDNLVVSPVSVALALQMVATGARGTTAGQMAATLHVTDPAGAGAALLRSLRAAEQDPANTLRVADTVWAQRDLPIEPGYADTVRTAFAGEVRQVDFVSDPAAATGQIDRTIADQTGGMIPQLFPPGSLDASTRLVLADAVYLAASWARAFDPKQTRPAAFTTADGSVVRVPMMHQPDDQHPDAKPAFGYAAGTGYQAVTLPYTGGKLAFTVLLPASGTSLTPLLGTLRGDGLAKVLAAVRPTNLDISMPRFTLSSTLGLNGTLAELGMPDAFTDRADFTGITTAEPLHIQTVRHDAVIRVDEHGTTAAAATGGGMSATAMSVGVVVVVNRPFLFVITDTATGAPLFLGRVTNPLNE